MQRPLEFNNVSRILDEEAADRRISQKFAPQGNASHTSCRQNIMYEKWGLINTANPAQFYSNRVGLAALISW
jgi:hypothetical protein